MTTTGRTAELDEMLAMLADQRRSLLITVRGLDEEQARRRTTVSELTLGGLLVHLAQVERSWRLIMIGQPPERFTAGNRYSMAPDDTLAALTSQYQQVARETEQAARSLADLDTPVALPEAPWFPERQYWSPRRILLHLLRETAHHCGHADIIRESLDGATTTEQWKAASMES